MLRLLRVAGLGFVYAALSVMLVSGVVSIAGLLARDTTAWYVAACAGAGVLYSKLVVDRLTRKAHVPALPVATSAAALVIAAGLFFTMTGAASKATALHAWIDPFARHEPSETHTNIVFAGVIAAVVVISLVPSKRWDAVRPRIQGAAAASVVTLAVLCALALFRAWKVPGIDAYQRHLRGSERTFRAPGVDPPIWPHSLPGGPKTQQRDPMRSGVQASGWKGQTRRPFEDVMVVHTCGDEGCAIGLAAGEHEPVVEPAPEGKPLFQGWNDLLHVARDRSGGAIYARVERRIQEHLWTDHPRTAMQLEPAHVAARTAPPSRWIWLSLLGLAVATGLLAARSPVSGRRLRALAGARQGTLGEDGWVVFADGPSVRVDPSLAMKAGPVVVMGGSSATAYREQEVLTRGHVLAGTLAEKREEAVLRCVHHDMTILATVALAAAPLLAALVTGLLLGTTPLLTTGVEELSPKPTPASAPAPRELAPGPDARLRAAALVQPAVIQDVDGDGTEDVLVALTGTTPAVSGPRVHDFVGLIDGRTLKRRWVYGPHLSESSRNIVVSGSLVVIAGGEALQAIDLRSGKELRRVALPESALSVCTPPDAAGEVWVGTYAGSLLVDLRTGTQQNALSPSGCSSPESPTRCAAGSGQPNRPCGATPTPSESEALKAASLRARVVFRQKEVTLALGTRSAERGSSEVEVPFVLALDPSTSAVLWQHPVAPEKTVARAEAAPATLESGRLFTTYNTGMRYVVAFDPVTGKRLWEQRIPGFQHTAPPEIFVTAERVYLSCQDGIAVMDAHTGALLGTIGEP